MDELGLDLPEELAAAVAAGEILPHVALQIAQEALANAQGSAESAGKAQRERVKGLGAKLQSQLDRQISLRAATEQRWADDLRQYNGLYNPGTFPDVEGNAVYGSRVYVPLTRRIVNLVVSRLYDTLFPAGDRNWTIEPTPVPDLSNADQLLREAKPNQSVQMPEQKVMAQDLRKAIREMEDEAKRRADGMQREIDDQLSECDYGAAARNAIHDSVLLGTGVLKGPTVIYKDKKTWVKQAQPDGTEVAALQIERVPVPSVERVDLWDFYPDMSARTVDDVEFIFQRHALTRRKMADLVKVDGFDPDAIREVLNAEPGQHRSTTNQTLQEISGLTGVDDRRYEVWEYHGPVEKEDLEACGCRMPEDPLIQPSAIVWVCDGVVLKAAVNPLDSGAHPYSVFYWQADDTCIFGMGLPSEVRDPQETANSSFRAMLDNMGLTVGPQIVINDNVIEPVDGLWQISPLKLWRLKNAAAPIDKVFAFHQIDSRVKDLSQIFQGAKTLMEEIVSMPGWMQGQDAPQYMQTATGASIAYTAASLWVRRCVRNWDDDVTSPLIDRMFEWNMLYNPNEEIKGDAQVVARGVLALVELEGQAQRWMQFMELSAKLGMPPSNQYQQMREFARALKLDPDKVLPSEEEIAAMQKAEQEAGPKVDPEQMKVQVAQENNQLDAKTAAASVAMKQEQLAWEREKQDRSEKLELLKIASTEQLTMQQAAQKYGFEEKRAAADLINEREQRTHDAQAMNAELQAKFRLGSGI